MPQSFEQLTVDVPTYQPGAPLQFAWEQVPRLAIDCDRLQVSIAGDQQSLRALAVALLALAGEQVPDGEEFAADSWMGMTGEVPHLVLRRAAAA